MNHTLQPYSVKPEDFGNFMSAVYGEWAREKNEVHVQLFDVIEEKRLGLPCSLCTHDFVCGHSLVIEANGDVYSCDRYVNADYLRGNIASTHLGELGEKNRDFGMDKAYGLSRECLECPHVKLCMGGCPKDRFVVSGSGYKNYLCEGYKQFFSHVSG